VNELVYFVISFAVLAVVCFGTFARVSKSLRSHVIATIMLLVAFLVLAGLGSALVGPLDLRPMIVVAPMIIALSAIWFIWKLRTNEEVHG
jgi:hypothetical protein